MSFYHVYSGINTPVGWLMLILFTLFGNLALAQKNVPAPGLINIQQSDNWSLRNREALYNKGEVHLSAAPGDGMLWLNNLKFTNGTISFDVKGKDEAGRSFVGIAFHGMDDNTYDAVYFRPFNFRNPERKQHAVQYISGPKFSWDKLRSEHPGVYENAIDPPLDPNDWFHVTLVVEHPRVRVYVNHAKEPVLEISQLSTRGTGWVGFMVGNNSAGSFRNLKISATPQAVK